MAVNTAYVSSQPENGSETAEKSHLPRMGTILSAKSLLNPIFLRAGSFDILLRDVRSPWKLQEFAFLLRSSLANTNETITKLVPSSLEIVPDSNDILGTKMAGEVLLYFLDLLRPDQTFTLQRSMPLPLCTSIISANWIKQVYHRTFYGDSLLYRDLL